MTNYYQATDADGWVYFTTDRDEALPERRYSTRNEAIYREIVEPLENGELDGETAYDDFDVDAIAEEILGSYEQGYACQVTTDEFWAVVMEHAR